jgi:hypothetical protein
MRALLLCMMANSVVKKHETLQFQYKMTTAAIPLTQ